MTQGLRFSNAFWDSDIIGTYGWDTLCKRMKDGKKVCSEIAHYLKDRATTEQEYSKSLVKLARKVDGKEEIGILGDSWQALKAQTERIAAAHEDAAALFKEMYDELNQFNEDQKKKKHDIEENVKKYISMKKSDFQKTMSTKKNYEQKCQEYNSTEETLKTLERNATTTPKDKQKAQTKLDKALDARTNADTAYKSAVKCLESSRENWEKETESAYDQFELLEKLRIQILREQLWKTTNVDSDVCVKHDQCSENVRIVLERCDITEEIQKYIEDNKAGTKRPDPILYEDYYNGANGGGNTPKTRRGPPQMRAPQPPPGAGRHTSEEGLYTTVDDALHAPSKVLVTVVKEHTARKPAEMNVKVGDRLELLDQRPTHDGLLKVKLDLRNGSARVGYVPSTCVTSNKYVNVVF